MRITLLAVVVCAVLAPSRAQAWNYTGHRTIATIAYDELTPAVLAKIDAILKAHPRYDRDLLGEMPQGFPEPERFAFAMSGFWPDIIRSQTNPMHFTNHRPSWHYINVPFELPDWKPATAPSTPPAASPAASPTAAPTAAPSAAPSTASATQPADEGAKDVVEAIAKNKAVLRDPAAPADKKAVALCWLVHTVADLHQPLHATTLFSAQFPEGDKGGNSFIVSVRRENKNLHAIWDEMLGFQTSPAMINYLAGAIRTDPNLSRDALPQVGKSDPEVWKRESHELGRAVAYRNGTLQGASSDDVRRDTGTIVPLLPEGYIRDGEPVAARRAALAGYRLADLLNVALGD